MLVVNTKQYSELLKECFNKKSPLYVYGGYGIGKSMIPRQVFQGIAEESKREFVEWSDLSMDQKLEAIANPGKYWIFCDQRLAGMDPSEIRGLANLANKDMLELVPLSWIVYFTKPEAMGAIFFDELNLAAPTIAAQAYQIINERTVSDRKLSSHVYVFGAGNRAMDRAHVFEMPAPLRDRFNEVEVAHDKKSWTEWAFGKVNPHLISFVQWKESYLYKPAKESNQKGSTPRGIVRASNLIGDRDITSDLVHTLVSISVGEAFATEFQAYTKHYAELEWSKIYKNPESIKNMSIDKIWAIIGGIAEHYTKKEKEFDDVMSIVMALNDGKEDFGIVSLRLIRDVDTKGFSTNFKKSKYKSDIVKKFGQYIMA